MNRQLLAGLLVLLYFSNTSNQHAIGDLQECVRDEDCHRVAMCTQDHPCVCHTFSPILGTRCIRMLWAEKLQTAVERVNDEPDIGPDTCGQDRTLLGTWFQNHGGVELIQDPRPPLVTRLEEDPYNDPSNPPLDPEAITGYCAMQWQDTVDPESGKKQYTLANFSTEAEAIEAGWNITHKGHCGSCSSLQDLGVYISRNLTSATRKCGALGFVSEQAEINCLKNLGFSTMCSQIWVYNIHHTRQKCMGVCIWSWITNEPFNKPDGSLNDCLQCDEDKSGPNFKYFSGRTRRNSGIPSAIHRPPETIYNMTHCYWYGDINMP